ncbi:MAG: LacI family transcriptional regulator [Lachnospiraceae bacterium]|nr:LacI family transcriptional regulator [Lachnospiraceae bacterium]
MSIKKIAELSGVSPATVSRVLNNPDYKCQSPEVRNRIWRVAIDLNYTPNLAARNLKLGVSSEAEKTFCINVLMTRTDAVHTDPFFSELLHVIESETHKNNCVLSQVWYMPVFSDDKKCKNIDLESLIDATHKEVSDKSDGLVIIGKCNKRALQIWSKKYSSIVSVNRNSTNYTVDEVTCDGQKVATIAVNHLIELGHVNLGYVGSCHNEARYRGFINVLHDNKIDLEPEYILETQPSKKDGYEAMRKYLKMENPPTGIYCANDIIAIGMLECLNKYKKLHYNPSIIASDDIDQAQFTKPMLTTVRLPRDEMGRFAIQLITDRLKGGHKSVTRIELEGKLICRSSCHNLDEDDWNSY